MHFGWLVTNHFLHSNKLSEIYQWLREAAERRNIQLLQLTNFQVLEQLKSLPALGMGRASKTPDFVLFWDKDIYLASLLEKKGFPLFNSSRSIGLCDDKALTYLALLQEAEPESGINILQPATVMAPKTFENIGYNDLAFVDFAADTLGTPMVIKECFGSFGQQVYLADTRDIAKEIVRKIGPKPILFQELIESSFGRDVRINVADGQVKCAMLRTSRNGDFRSNISNGGIMEGYTPSPEQCDAAIAACEALGLDFAGVDVLFGPGGMPIICEVNSNLHFKSSFDCTGVNMADHIVEMICRKMGWNK